jgi:transcriptional regulator with XRE-family HTH domain
VLLQRYRLAAGLSQEELAERAGLGRRRISGLERGVRRAPYPASMRRLAEAPGLNSDQRDAWFSSVPVAATAPETPCQPHTVESTNRLITEFPDGDIPNLAKMVRRHRLEACFTQGALAEKTGLSLRSISDLERGIREFSHADSLERLSIALELAAVERPSWSLPQCVSACVAKCNSADRPLSLGSRRPRLEKLP